MHFYQFHIGDYMSHTHHLSPLEDIAYRRLLDYYYLHETPIKQQDIARYIGMRGHEDVVLLVLSEFFVSTEAGFIHPRADAEIAKYREFSEAGKRGAAKRWAKATPEATVEPPLKGGNGEAISPPSPTPIATNNHKPITKNQRKSANKLACPPEVEQQVWDDWYALRDAKKAPITQTVLASAIVQADKAGITLNDYLKIWCARGSQGMSADWIKPEEKTAVAGASKFAGDI